MGSSIDSLAAVAARSPSGPRWMFDTHDPELASILREQLNEAMRDLPPSAIDNRVADPRARLFAFSTEGNPRRIAAESLVHELLIERSAELRLQALGDSRERQPPLDQPSLRSLRVDSDSLVSLSAFTLGPGVLTHGDYAVLPFPPAPSSNSYYWLLGSLVKLRCPEAVSIRLDPFMHGPSTQFFGLMQLMQIWGRPLDWDRVRALSAMEHGQWISDPPLRDVLRTDYVWEPRGHEVHFVCEELPTECAIRRRGARYLHAILDRSSCQITHVDGALRTYDPTQYSSRSNVHLREAGKAGRRHKLFRVDAAMNSENFCEIAASFFVWNQDAGSYFQGPPDGPKPA